MGFALIAVKVAITGLWIAQRHHIASMPPHAIEETLWWITKVSPPMFVAAFAMDARQMGNRFYERFFEVLFLIAVVASIIVTYAMLHGYKGISL